MKTKERIMDAALTLFSTRGYQGTSVKNIADAVGIKDSSLYKHFSSKKEIFNTIVQEMSQRMEQMSKEFQLPAEADMGRAVNIYASYTEEMLVQVSRQVFLFYLRDEFAARFRRMLAVEQYRDREIYEVYREIYMDAAITYQTQLFEAMTREGIFKRKDPQTMAINFYAPIFFLLNKYDQEPGREQEALEALDRQVLEFARIYRN